ncbi:carbohydrate-binding domain-containing protein [Collinsella sp. AF19-7AC]|nr:carbohydrate-binding domain-containing protein [Collinsella sp. AF19-7AC]RGT33250.1 carbohydrate-binding domain-containing protein [Collinsella sp. AF19-1LB]RHB16960.1 carbohydrate-binding domain-containing protein [Collinsella sp. AM40-7AC]RHE29766.1 carbohydrate-binding domain-containing protein [Collinsella sp. AM29-10AC]RHJ58565.1 carbohydrate-binding domain-containing protein [Collinsella sp. AM09-41]
MRPRAFLLAPVPAPACGLFLPHFGHFALHTALPPATSSRYAESSRIGPMRTGATMAALFTTPKRNDTTAGTHVAEPDVRRRIGLAHGSWRRVTRRIVVGAVCALTVSSLLMPSVSLAAEWVKVGGNKYNTAASDEAGTWSWDGADDLKLSNYNGGEIQAAGKLNVNYSGTNIVTAEWIESINVSHGTNENAELNIQGDEGGTLSVTSTEDAILSTGNIKIDGAGSVNATSTGFDAINAGGDLAIKGSGNVNATGASDGIRANGNITIDDSGAVTARATKDKGIGTDKNLTIKGGGAVEASSADGEALWSGGNINISDGSQVKASSEKDAAIEAKGSLAATNASLNVNGVEYGVYAHKGITLDHANVTVRASKGRYGGAIALFTYQDDIVVKNGSTVDAFAEGEVSAAFSTRNDRPNEKGGHIYISDSVVKAIARYVENGDGPIPYSENQDGETRREPQGENIGIIAQTSEGVTPAVISIIRSKVTVEGDTAAIFARAMSADGKTIGTIKIENAAIQTPEGGKVIDYRKLRDGIYEAGQAIGTGDATVDSLYIKAVAKSTTIAPPEVAKPEDPKPDETKQNPKPEGSKPTKAVAASTTKAKTTGVLAATGDTSGAAIVATVLAGTAAIAAGTMASRKRS